jgi:hypothetical protein
LCAFLGAQTLVVDAQNGPGTHFTDLPAAIAAAPSGAVLHVRPGTYSPFTIAQKSLTVIGHPDANGTRPSVATTVATPRIVIGPTSAGQSVALSGLRGINASPAPSSLTLLITQCQGPVVLEDISMVPLTTPAFVNVANSRNVHAYGLTLLSIASTETPPVLVQGSSVEFTRLSASGYPSFAAGGSGTPAILATLQSRVVLVDSSVIGGKGNNLSGLASAGGPAVRLAGNCTLHAYANPASGATIAFRGGAGGTGFPAGPGGNALELVGSTARVRGIALTGGSGAPAGQPFVKDAGSTLDHDPSGIASTGQLVGAVRPNTTVFYTLHARAASPAALLIGLSAQFQAVPPVALGMLGVDPLFSVPAGNVPGSGTVGVPSAVPPTWPDDTMVLAQFVVLDPTIAELELSNVFPATSRY